MATMIRPLCDDDIVCNMSAIANVKITKLS